MKALNQKAKLLGISIAAAGLFAMGSAAQAAPIIAGEINFAGSYKPGNDSFTPVATVGAATSLIFQGAGLAQHTVDNQQTGAYAVLNGADRTANFYNFKFPIGAPSLNPAVAPVWDVVFGANHFWFDLNKVAITFQNATTLILDGTGIAYGAGYDSAPGTFSLTANTSGSKFSFSASSAVPVPAALFFAAPALLGVFGVSRRKNAAGSAA